MPSSSQFVSETLTLAMLSEDDDDFQNPTQAISLSQHLILSSLRSSSSKPLKPSNGDRPRKKTKRSTAPGKENCEVPHTPEFDSGVCGKQKRNSGVQEEVWTDSAPIIATPMEVPLTPLNGCALSAEHIEDDGVVKGTCSVSASVGMNLGEFLETQSPRSRAPEDCCQNKGLKAGNGSYSTSIESRLLGSRTRYNPGVENAYLEESTTADFEADTQLNKLTEMCSEMFEENTDCIAVLEERNDMAGEDFVMQEDHSVECPLCGTDITDLAEEMRQIHTNYCLDKGDTPKVFTSSLGSDPISHQQRTDVSPVREWLQTLGLSRYEEAFVKEEIDWETLQWITEEDFISLGIDALGPRKKIMHSLAELYKRSGYPHDRHSNAPSVKTADETKLSPGNKLITEYFPGLVDGKNISIVPNMSNGVQIANKNSCRRKASARNSASNGKLRDIPSWCCIPGTPFRVDAFRYLRGDCSHWFLTHFHLDHYQGLTRNFCRGKIYCSSITAHLLNLKIGIPWDMMHVLALNQKICIEGVNVTCLDANHCPGSLIILFEPPSGKAVLHTGDFRFCAEMASSSVLQSCSIHTLILDTTYCNPQYDFPKQEAVIQFVIEAIQAESFNSKTLFLIGSYTIGKERLFLEVARVLRKKVYVGAAKLRLLQCLGFPEEDMRWFTLDEKESQIHIVPMWTIASFKRMKHISNLYSERYNLIVAFSPTGWTFGKGKRKSPGRRWQQGTIIRYEVPYSEHSCFTELREFVKLLSPENIIPSVNNSSPECADAMAALLLSDA